MYLLFNQLTMHAVFLISKVMKYYLPTTRFGKIAFLSSATIYQENFQEVYPGILYPCPYS